MAKLGVYIPDAKMPEVEEWREKVNFSQLFMEAFERAVLLEKTLEKLERKEMQDVIKRLKAEQEEDFRTGETKGREDGQQWAKNDAALADLRRICEADEDTPESMEDMLITGDWCDNDYFDTQSKGCDRDCFMRGYFRGFVEGATSIWEQVKSHLD